MKKSSLKSSTILPVLSMVMTILVLPSCRSVEAVTSDAHNSSLITHSSHHDTVLRHDSIYLHDSVIYRERTIHDTVYITKEVYRDRLEARGERQKAVRTDTVVVTEWREKVIEHPPERYVPKFYKWCTIALWAIGLWAIGYGLLRWRLKRKWLHVGG